MSLFTDPVHFKQNKLRKEAQNNTDKSFDVKIEKETTKIQNGYKTLEEYHDKKIQKFIDQKLKGPFTPTGSEANNRYLKELKALKLQRWMELKDLAKLEMCGT